MKNKTIIGVDEAGYGPNLGPLVIAATAWTVPTELDESAIREASNGTFATRKLDGINHIPLGDSKQLYSSHEPLDSLEAGIFACWQSADLTMPNNLDQLLSQVLPKRCHQDFRSSSVPWYQSLVNMALPCNKRLDSQLPSLANLARSFATSTNIALREMKTLVITEAEFNAGVERYQSKGQLLSVSTLELVQDLLPLAMQNGPVEIYCDRQGGRKHYLPVLAQVFPDLWFFESKVSQARSSYYCDSPMRLDVHFSVQGDSFPPTGLASMLAKYLRELFMETFNAFWQSKLPELKSTAGYPVDAKRFRAEIESTANKLDLPIENWWRSR